MFNVQQITSRLSMMSDAQLAHYAELHKDDPYILPLASAEAKRRQQNRLAAAGQQAAQAGQKPTIADQNIASMQLPEEQGIGVLPETSLATMADGGIAGYAKGKDVFDPDKYIGNPNVEKFLAYINAYEGSPQANHLVGYRRFDSLEDHPRKAVKFNKRGDKSTAAGMYQLLSKTWDEQKKKLGLTDFSPENQKRAAIGLLKDRGALQAVVKGDFDTAKKKASNIWASIPGSTIGEATGQKARFKPQAEAMLKTPTPSPTRMVEREQAPVKLMPSTQIAKATQARQPDLSRRIFDMLPFSSAAAADVVPRPAEVKPTVSAPYSDAALYTDTSVPTPERLRAEEKAREKEQPSWLTKRGRELAGAPEAGLSALTGAISPLTGTLYAAGRTLAGTPTTAEEGFGATTFAPRSEYGKESLAEMQRAFEDFKIPPFIPGVGTASARPKAGKAITAAELAEAEAARAAQAVETAKAPRLEGPKPAGKPSPVLDIRQRFAEAQERAAQAAEAAGDAEKAARLREGLQRPKEFTPSPEAQQMGVQALLERRRREQSADVRKAQEAAAAAEKKAAEARGLAEREGALDTRDAVFATARRQAEARRNILAPGVIGAGAGVKAPVPEPSAEEVPDKYMQPFSYGSDYGQGQTQPTPDKLEAAKELAQQVAPKAEGFSNEDILTMGLNMMMAQPGQPGGALSQLLSNVGRSGIATLGARRERELRQQEKEYKDVMKGYYGKLTELYGRPEAEERQIAQILKENPGIRYDEAVRRLYEAKYASRGETALEAARLRNPFASLFDQGLMEPSGGLTPQGQSIFNKYFPKQ
jgi:muramidase (phage lysozyme)